MNENMSPELYWMILTAAFTSILWAPHILMRIIELKPYDAFRDPRHDVATKTPWAQRAIRAHTNGVENLIVFGLLAISVHILEAGTALSATAASVYFFARVGHYVIYVLAIPWLRTPTYLVGFACQVILAGSALGF